jgi:hypothetical protein
VHHKSAVTAMSVSNNPSAIRPADEPRPLPAGVSATLVASLIGAIVLMICIAALTTY